MENRINVGIVGFGVSGRIFHAPFFLTSPKYNWTTVVERNSNEAVAFYSKIKTVRTAEELFNDPSIHLAIITTPTETHFSLAKQAMLAGKHVVAEKPFTVTTEEAKELIEISRQQHVVLSIYQNRRYTSDFLAIKEILDKQLLGEPVIFESYFDRYRPEKKANSWREADHPGSGILYDLGSHLIDQSLHLFGLPISVTATILKQRSDVKADDYFDVRLNYGKLQVRLRSSMLVREMGPRYMVHGTKGSFIKSGMDPQEDQLKNGMMPGDAGFGVEPEESWGLLHTKMDEQIILKKYPSHQGNFGIYYDELYETIVRHAPLQVTPQQALHTIRIIELAIKSSAFKCEVPVSIPD